jgi:hypothetical protein
VSESEIAPPRRKRKATGRRTELLPRRAADVCTVEKSRGRLEIRELWVVAADDLEAYLAEEWGWQGVRQLGWLRRWRKRRPSDLWSVEQVTIVSSRGPERTSPAQLLGLVRGHWTIENRVHWPRDMSFHEDRLHGRAIGTMLAWLRNIALNLIRRVWPGSFIPDAWSRLSVDPRAALRWLHLPLKN